MDLVSYIKSFPVREYAKGEVLLNAGERSDQLFAIREGFVKVSSLDDSGRQKLLWIAGRYDLIPSENLFSHGRVRFYYSSMSQCSVYCINKTELLAYAKENADVMLQIARGLSEHYDDLLGRINAVEQSDLHTKILYVLHNLCERLGSASVMHFNEMGLQLTHQDIADMIGSTRESASIELNRLREERFIDYSRSTFTVYYDTISEALDMTYQ